MSVIREVARLTPRDGVDLKATLGEVGHLLAEAPGCCGFRLDRCVEQPQTYLLTVGWTSLKAHVEDFRQSAAWSEFVAVLRDSLIEPAVVEHYEPVLQA